MYMFSTPYLISLIGIVPSLFSPTKPSDYSGEDDSKWGNFSVWALYFLENCVLSTFPQFVVPELALLFLENIVLRASSNICFEMTVFRIWHLIFSFGPYLKF